MKAVICGFFFICISLFASNFLNYLYSPASWLLTSCKIPLENLTSHTQNKYYKIYESNSSLLVNSKACLLWNTVCLSSKGAVIVNSFYCPAFKVQESKWDLLFLKNDSLLIFNGLFQRTCWCFFSIVLIICQVTME